jgi:hypothetical protein
VDVERKLLVSGWYVLGLQKAPVTSGDQASPGPAEKLIALLKIPSGDSLADSQSVEGRRREDGGKRGKMARKGKAGGNKEGKRGAKDGLQEQGVGGNWREEGEEDGMIEGFAVWKNPVGAHG